MSEEQPKKAKRSEKAKERGRRKHFKFCREHAPHMNPLRHRDVYPRWWESTLKLGEGD